eukprot:scaffold255_cov124-Pinguiococcus_pyrenoidosus.AAC.1
MHGRTTKRLCSPRAHVWVKRATAFQEAQNWPGQGHRTDQARSYKGTRYPGASCRGPRVPAAAAAMCRAWSSTTSRQLPADGSGEHAGAALVGR